MNSARWVVPTKKIIVCSVLTLVGVPGSPMLNWHPAVAVSRDFAQLQNSRDELDTDLAKLDALRESRDLDSLETVINRESPKWKARDRQSFLAYMFGACGEISSYDYPDRSKQATLLTRYAISVLSSGPLSLEERVPFVEFLGLDPSKIDETAWKSLRQEKARFWLETWRLLSETRDLKFDPQDVPMINVAPPPGAGVPAGGSPTDIKDPKLRAEYERAIARNRAKIERFNEQHYVRTTADRFYEEAQRYLVNAYSRTPSDPLELERLLAEYIGDEAARNRVLEEVRERLHQQ
jgi:hypothetical protein